MPFSIDNLRKFQTLQAKERSREADELRELRALKARKPLTTAQKARLEQLVKQEAQEAKIKNVGLKQQPSIFNNQDVKNTMKGFSSIFNNKEQAVACSLHLLTPACNL